MVCPAHNGHIKLRSMSRAFSSNDCARSGAEQLPSATGSIIPIERANSKNHNFFILIEELVVYFLRCQTQEEKPVGDEQQSHNNQHSSADKVEYPAMPLHPA